MTFLYTNLCFLVIPDNWLYLNDGLDISPAICEIAVCSGLELHVCKCCFKGHAMYGSANGEIKVQRERIKERQESSIDDLFILCWGI